MLQEKIGILKIKFSTKFLFYFILYKIKSLHINNRLIKRRDPSGKGNRQDPLRIFFWLIISVQARIIETEFSMD